MTQTTDIAALVETINDTTSELAYYSESAQLTRAHIARHRAEELYNKIAQAYRAEQPPEQPKTAEDYRAIIQYCDQQLDGLHVREDELLRQKNHARFELSKLTGIKELCWYCFQYEDSDRSDDHLARCSRAEFEKGITDDNKH